MIRVIENVGAPVAVAAIDMLTLEMAPDYNEMVDYIMTGAGYLGGVFLKGTIGDFMASMGAASLPLTARAIRERVKGGAVSSHAVGTSRLAFRATSNPGIRSYPSQPQNTQRWPSAV